MIWRTCGMGTWHWCQGLQNTSLRLFEMVQCPILAVVEPQCRVQPGEDCALGDVGVRHQCVLAGAVPAWGRMPLHAVRPAHAVCPSPGCCLQQQEVHTQLRIPADSPALPADGFGGSGGGCPCGG